MVYFVESSAKAARMIRRNLSSLKVEDGFEIIERDATIALRMLDSQAVSCDFCFLDPPYRKMGDYEQVLGFLSQSRIIRPDSTVIAEHDKHFDPGDSSAHYAGNEAPAGRCSVEFLPTCLGRKMRGAQP